MARRGHPVLMGKGRKNKKRQRLLAAALSGEGRLYVCPVADMLSYE